MSSSSSSKMSSASLASASVVVSVPTYSIDDSLSVAALTSLRIASACLAAIQPEPPGSSGESVHTGVIGPPVVENVAVDALERMRAVRVGSEDAVDEVVRESKEDEAEER